MANITDPDRPLDWANCDSLWGGELFKSTEDSATLGIKKDDEFRIEKMKGTLTLIPKPRNDHMWAHDKDHPVVLKKEDTERFNRAFYMDVTFKNEEKPQRFHFVEMEDYSTRIQKKHPDDQEANGGSANLRR
jgi:hypothetical protein